MITHITYRSETYTIDLSKPLDISIPMRGDHSNVTAWYVGPPEIGPHISGDFVGKVSEGGSTNFNDIRFNPHAHGTHTECVGHITEDFHSVNGCLENFFYLAELVTITPEVQGEDLVISRSLLQTVLGDRKFPAVIIRTMPNSREKLSRQYSHSNPPYLSEGAAQLLAEKKVEHLLVDLPSVDREKDNGALLAHRAFWNFKGPLRLGATITEFIFVDNGISDGAYFLDLQVASFENDASPSRPVLYKILTS